MRRILSMFLCLGLVVGNSPLRAEMIGTEQLLETAAATDGHAALQAFLQRDEVRQQLEAMGVAADDAAARVAALTDAEARMLAERLNELPAGGDGAGLLIVGFLIVLLLELLGAIDIFPRF